MSVKMKLFDNVFNIIGSAFILNIFKHVLNLFRLFLRMSNAFIPVARFSKLPYHLNVCSLVCILLTCGSVQLLHMDVLVLLT